jgi:hypothetical protein
MLRKLNYRFQRRAVPTKLPALPFPLLWSPWLQRKQRREGAAGASVLRSGDAESELRFVFELRLSPKVSRLPTLKLKNERDILFARSVGLADHGIVDAPSSPSCLTSADRRNDRNRFSTLQHSLSLFFILEIHHLLIHTPHTALQNLFGLLRRM